MQERAIGVALPAAFVADVVNPSLLSFGIDMGTGLLSMVFNEVVRATSINVTGLTLQSTGIGGAVEFTLLGGTAISSDNSVSVVINITAADLSAIKALPLAGSIDDTFLKMVAGTIEDMNGNNVNAVAASSALQASNYLRDIVSPFLRSFELNMNRGLLTMEFSENVPPSSVVPSSFVLQSASDSTDSSISSHALTGGNVSTEISTIIELTLTADDLNAIKASPALAMGFDSAFLYFDQTAVTDSAGNNVTAVLSNAAERASVFVVDTTRPSLVSFSLNMNAGTMSIEFSETVDSSTFNATAVSVQSTADGSSSTTSSLTLTGATSSTAVPSTTVSFELLKADLDSIKVIDSFATALSDTFVSVNHNVISDMASNPAIAVKATAGVAATNYTADATAPTAVSFGFNLNDGVLVLNMSEPVQDSVDVTALTVVSAADPVGHTLQTGSNVTLLDGQRLVKITLSATDLNAIKARASLATSDSNTVLTLGSSFALDKAGNNAGSVLASANTTPTSFVPDTTQPALVSFALDLRTNTLRLTFSEAVNASSILPTGLALRATQGNATTDFSTYFLTGGVVLNTTQCPAP
jgi:uncharacterized cupredoxin-like copper-binding protein